MMVKTKVKVDMAPVQQVMKRLGVTPTGDVQMCVTNMVNGRITRYMPFRAGVMATKTKFMGGGDHQHLAEGKKKIVSPTEIEILGPYAHYQYRGKLWVDAVTGSAWARRYGKKVETAKDLTYDKSKNPQAGPFWDRRLIAAEGDAMAADVQKYINTRKEPK